MRFLEQQPIGSFCPHNRWMVYQIEKGTITPIEQNGTFTYRDILKTYPRDGTYVIYETYQGNIIIHTEKCNHCRSWKHTMQHNMEYWAEKYNRYIEKNIKVLNRKNVPEWLRVVIFGILKNADMCESCLQWKCKECNVIEKCKEHAFDDKIHISRQPNGKVLIDIQKK